MWAQSNTDLRRLMDYARAIAYGHDDLESAALERLTRCMHTYDGRGNFYGYARSRMKFAVMDAKRTYVMRLAREAVLSPEQLAHAERRRPLRQPTPWLRYHTSLPNNVIDAIETLPNREHNAVVRALTMPGEFDLRRAELRDAVHTLRTLLGVTP